MKTFIRFQLIAIMASDDFVDAGDVYVDPVDIVTIAPSLYGKRAEVRPNFCHIHLRTKEHVITVKGNTEEIYKKILDIP